MTRRATSGPHRDGRSRRVSRVLATGGTGFVGRALLTELAARGIAVHAVVRTGTADRLPAGTAERVVETEDVFDETPQWWSERLAGVDMAIHAAWCAEPGRYLTDPRNLDCLTGTISLARGAAAAGLGRLVGIGSCFEYDLTSGLLSPDTRLDPKTPYAAAKAAACMVLGQFLPAHGVSFLWARLFHLHGPGEDPRRLVPYIHRQLASGEVAELTEGRQVRDFMDVRDAAAMLVDDALGDREGPTNIASGKGVTVRQLALDIAGTYGRPDLLRFGARPDNLTDPPRIVGVRDSAGA